MLTTLSHFLALPILETVSRFIVSSTITIINTKQTHTTSHEICDEAASEFSASVFPVCDTAKDI